MECPKCKHEMVYSSMESTPLRDIYRCFRCNISESQRTALSWTLTGARVLLFLTTGIPDLTDFLG